MTAGNAVKGSYATLIASTGFRYSGFYLMIGPIDAAAAITGLVDIAVGAAASEEVIVSDFYIESYNSSHVNSVCIFVPVVIAAGSRVSARAQASTSGGTIDVGVMGITGDAYLPSGYRNSVGMGVSGSRGSDIDAGATANTKGAYTQIVASTSNRIAALILSVGSSLNSAPADADFLVDIAIGGAGSEVVIIPDILVVSESTTVFFPHAIGPFPVNIPAGTRIAIRCQSTTNDATDRIMDVVLQGVEV